MPGGAGRGERSSLLTPCLMVYYLCCWPQDEKSDSSSERPARRGTFPHESRGAGALSRRAAASAADLHRPGPSGHRKQSLAAHRSHEEIGRRSSTDDSRYHSAPSVIHEVVHRRAWERSARELFIPLRPGAERERAPSDSSGSPEAPRAQPEGSSEEELHDYERVVGRPCKKHYTNIKSSKGRKERQVDDDKDCDATEASSFYIGDNEGPATLTHSPYNENPRDATLTHSPRNEYFASAAESPLNEYHTADSSRNEFAMTSLTSSPRAEGSSSALGPSPPSASASSSPRREEPRSRSVLRAKEAKQSFNESIRSRERPRPALGPLDERCPRSFAFSLDEVLQQLESLDSLEPRGRSGAALHAAPPRARPPRPPPSVETVGYEGGACYLSERPPAPAPAPAGLRARHASDGDILAPPLRPESGAFSESDLDLEMDLELADEEPPPYEALPRPAPASPPSPASPARLARKETAI